LLAGSRLLNKEHYDVVYFSTTVFSSFTLARIWRRRFGCKIVFDVQDPWYQGGNHSYDRSSAPGGWLKYELTQKFSYYGEAYAFRAPDHVISVSPGYIKNLSARYLALHARDFTVIPFGIAPIDHQVADRHRDSDGSFADTNKCDWVYVGRGGPDIAPVFEIFFRGLARLRQRNPDFVRRLKIHFVGTNYSPPDRTFKVVEPIAARIGVEELVEERPSRVPYFEAINLMKQSHAILLFGSKSSHYTASKLLSCLFCEQPVVALFHAESLVSSIAASFPNIRLATFANSFNTDVDTRIDAALDWLVEQPAQLPVPSHLFEPYLAENLTRAQCDVFDQVMKK
jgi:glycosyltransferase involved in cell wall biosynthesis